MAGKPGASGTNRNPDKFCKAVTSEGSRCAAYALKNLDVCAAHGGSSPGAVDARSKAEIAQAVGMLGLPVPVDVEDFPDVAGQYVGLLNQFIAGLLADLRERKQDSTDVALAREYADILDRINATAKLTAQMMEAVARLKAAAPKKPKSEKPPADILEEKLAAVRARLQAANPCPLCGHDKRTDDPPPPPGPVALDDLL